MYNLAKRIKPMVNKIKLSKAQQEVIKAMQAGSILHKVTGINAHCFLSITTKNVSWPTVFALQKSKLIVFVDSPRDRYELTDLGKAWTNA